MVKILGAVVLILAAGGIAGGLSGSDAIGNVTAIVTAIALVFVWKSRGQRRAQLETAAPSGLHAPECDYESTGVTHSDRCVRCSQLNVWAGVAVRRTGPGLAGPICSSCGSDLTLIFRGMAEMPCGAPAVEAMSGAAKRLHGPTAAILWGCMNCRMQEISR